MSTSAMTTPDAKKPEIDADTMQQFLARLAEDGWTLEDYLTFLSDSSLQLRSLVFNNLKSRRQTHA